MFSFLKNIFSQAENHERVSAELPRISDNNSVLNNTIGWTYCDDDQWRSEKNHIKRDSSTGHWIYSENFITSFDELEIRIVSMGDSQFGLFTIKDSGSDYFLFNTQVLNMVEKHLGVLNKPVEIDFKPMFSCTNGYSLEFISSEIYKGLKEKKSTQLKTLKLSLLNIIGENSKLTRFNI